ncbi:MAG: chemotaxis response regulator protein-glutamate methylesterase, partial [Bdellovibrio sp. CG12_big_fil_rev_8_21_14_0_65_39_13]
MKVLVVDDSVVFRMAISQALSEVPGISNPKTVSNGQLAIQHLKNFPDTDLITLDLEMPVMDGIQTIKEIRKFNRKVIIIVFSSLSVKGAEKTLEALTSGANDFVTKQEAGGATSIDASLGMIRELLLPKVSAFSKRQNSEPIAQETLKTKTEDLISMTIKPRLIVIGSSTGGPEALSTIFKGLNVRANIPILIVQHMPPIFTDKLAQMLNNLTPYAEV